MPRKRKPARPHVPTGSFQDRIRRLYTDAEIRDSLKKLSDSDLMRAIDFATKLYRHDSESDRWARFVWDSRGSEELLRRWRKWLDAASKLTPGAEILATARLYRQIGQGTGETPERFIAWARRSMKSEPASVLSISKRHDARA